ncbi:hypothetical protein [Streptomyces pseudogriseolus]|uniref:hypothetical protein n=1 Tax=Streptomyces pseudogriseolus TaxID=36817 RepID=UPI003654FD12
MPVGLVAVPLARVVLGESSLPGTRIDLLGMALATCGPVAVVWAIVHGESDGWTSRTVLGTFAAGAVLLAAFVLWERRARQPLLPLSLYRIRPFVLSNVVSVAMYFGFFGSIFLLAQYLQVAPERSPLHAGVLTLAWTLMPTFVAPLAGALTDRVGGGRLMALGLFLQAAGPAWLALAAGPDTPYTRLVGGMVIAGAGMGVRLRADGGRGPRLGRPGAPRQGLGRQHHRPRDRRRAGHRRPERRLPPLRQRPRRP